MNTEESMVSIFSNQNFPIKTFIKEVERFNLLVASVLEEDMLVP